MQDLRPNKARRIILPKVANSKKSYNLMIIESTVKSSVHQFQVSLLEQNGKLMKVGESE